MKSHGSMALSSFCKSVKSLVKTVDTVFTGGVGSSLCCGMRGFTPVKHICGIVLVYTGLSVTEASVGSLCLVAGSLVAVLVVIVALGMPALLVMLVMTGVRGLLAS